MEIRQILTPQGSKNSCGELKKRSQKVIDRYGNAQGFIDAFSHKIQVLCGRNEERCFTGEAPTIGVLNQAYGIKIIRSWLSSQFENLNDFAGTKNKMNIPQMDMLTDIIMTEYHFLKASELLLFFYKFKTGMFGELYGSVDPIRIASALIEFASYRRQVLFKLEEIQKRNKRIEDEKTWVRMYYKRIKKKFSKRKYKIKHDTRT